MPTVTNPNLTLTESEGRVTIRVSYDTTFTEFERRLVDLGADPHSHIIVRDFDGGDDPGAELLQFPRGNGSNRIDGVTVGSGSQTVPNKAETHTVPRADLKGDPANNDDEIKAEIIIHMPGLVEFTEGVVTEQEVLND